MKFIVYRCTKDPDYFIVTDEANSDKAKGCVCPSGGDIHKVGEYAEMGEIRAAFDETLAKNSIEHQGFYPQDLLLYRLLQRCLVEVTYPKQTTLFRALSEWANSINNSRLSRAYNRML